MARRKKDDPAGSDGQPTPTEGKAKGKSNEALLADMLAEYTLSEEATRDQRSKELEDARFEAGEHWTDADKQKRALKHEPTFTLDQVSGKIQEVANQPVHRIIVKADGYGADPKKAGYWQGWARRVENLSNAEDIYKEAKRQALVTGRAFWRVRADIFAQTGMQPDGVYDASIFNQDARVESFLNHHCVYEDPRARKLDYSDMRFCLITDDVLWTDLKAQYPTVEYADLESFNRGVGDGHPQWAKQDTCRIAERYWIEDESLSFCMLSTGEVVLKQPKAVYPEGVTVVKEHTFKIPRVKWMKATAKQVLEGPVPVAGCYIPVVKIVGEKRVIDGKTDYRGKVRMAKDPQRLVEFYATRTASVADIATLHTWLTPNEATEGFPEWDDLAEGQRPARLRWNTHRDGSPDLLPAPQIVSTAPVVNHLVLAEQRGMMHLRAVLGEPDVTPDEQKPEQSGVAIGKRDQQRQRANSHFSDSSKAGIRHTGRILIAMGRDILDAPRVTRIVDGEEDIELITYKGQEQLPQAQALAAKLGAGDPQQSHKVALLDVAVGEYDVDVSAGQDTGGARQESVEMMTGLIQAVPPMAPKVIPIMLKYSDSPGAQELAKALKPPDQQSGSVPVEEAQKAQMVIDKLTETVNQLHQQVSDQQADRDSKEKIAAMQNQTQIDVERMKLDADIKKALIELEKAKIELEHARLHPPQAPNGDRDGPAVAQ